MASIAEIDQRVTDVARTLPFPVTMPTDTLASLENAMFNEYSGDDYAPVIKKWIAENQEWVDSLTP